MHNAGYRNEHRIQASDVSPARHGAMAMPAAKGMASIPVLPFSIIKVKAFELFAKNS